jgi:hypothetical protein
MRIVRAAILVAVLLGGVVGGSYVVHRGPLPVALPGGLGSTATSPTTARTTTTVPRPPAGLNWQPLGDPIAGRPPMEVAFPTGDTQVVVWIDKTLVRPEVIPGRVLPGGTGWNPFAQVPAEARTALLAAFNGGFKFTDAKGGFSAQGRTAVPLVDGAASLVIHADATATVGQWGRDVSMDPTVVAVRQSLVLLVDGGVPAAAATRPYPFWGLTPTKSVIVWRSALGVDTAGNLIYVAAANIDSPAFAALVAKTGCVRAMQLDINHGFITFNTYKQVTPGVVHGTKLLGTMSTPADRYLVPDDRDFVALYRR